MAHRLRVKVFLVGKGAVCEFDAPFTTTIGDVKRKVTEALPSVLPENQAIFFAGKKLEPDTKTLEQCDVPAKAPNVTLLCTNRPAPGSAPATPTSSVPGSPAPSAATTSTPATPSTPKTAPVDYPPAVSSPVSTRPAPVPEVLAQLPGSPVGSVGSVASTGTASVDSSDSLNDTLDVASPDSSPSSSLSNSDSSAPATPVVLSFASDAPFDLDQLLLSVLHNPIVRDCATKPSQGVVSVKVTEALAALTTYLRGSIPPVPETDPAKYTEGALKIFDGLIKRDEDLALGPIPNYERLVEVTQQCTARRQGSPVPSYVDATRTKFERVLGDLKQSRNAQLAEQLLAVQAKMYDRNRDILDRPSVADTLDENQKQVDRGLGELRALVAQYTQAEVVFDSKVESLAKQIIPKCEEIERLADTKLDQLNSLREIYSGFAPLEAESGEICQPLRVTSATKEKDRLVCEHDLDTLKKLFAKLERAEWTRREELDKTIEQAKKHAQQTSAEQALLLSIINRLSHRFYANEQSLKQFAAQESSARKEMEHRAGLLVDANMEVKDREHKLQQRIKDLSAAITAIGDFEAGVRNEMQQLDILTDKSRQEHADRWFATLQEKHGVASDHYRLLYKKAHGLRTFTTDSAAMIEDLQRQLGKWSSMQRAQMVDQLKAQIAEVQAELRSVESELDAITKVLSSLDSIFIEINSHLQTLDHPPFQHPKELVEVECLEADMQRLAKQEQDALTMRAKTEEKLKEVSAKLEASRMAASVRASINPNH